jgi:hypothetical protein
MVALRYRQHKRLGRVQPKPALHTAGESRPSPPAGGRLDEVSQSDDVIALKQWGHHSGYYEVEWRRGRVLRHRLDGPPALSWGFAARCGMGITFLYRRPSDDHVVLQTGPSVVDLHADAVRTSYRSVFLASRLRVKAGTRSLVIRNITPGRLFGLVDLSYDELDAESDDFLLYLHAQLGSSSWADAVRDRWGPATPTDTE